MRRMRGARDVTDPEPGYNLWVAAANTGAFFVRFCFGSGQQLLTASIILGAGLEHCSTKRLVNRDPYEIATLHDSPLLFKVVFQSCEETRLEETVR
ncbi:hypothetical protein PtrSN002B_004284 [Pyrenophora tritici-repentis]|nr:hypothetical protein PtrSN002B_004284 [Pyrenophora tritici-repentis]KAI1577883.1 hypothetical protein PtrEW4_001417 [Pyrenophora tritici-repentis]KAI1589093.1 hypothetical protein PtrEW7m1_000119 [Pyrenophora tritici-repentis]